MEIKSAVHPHDCFFLLGKKTEETSINSSFNFLFGQKPFTTVEVDKVSTEPLSWCHAPSKHDITLLSPDSPMTSAALRLPCAPVKSARGDVRSRDSPYRGKKKPGGRRRWESQSVSVFTRLTWSFFFSPDALKERFYLWGWSDCVCIT